MPEGWVLTNYTDEFRKSELDDPADFRLGTKSDGSFLWVERVKRQDLARNLVQSMNLFLEELRSIEESRTVTNLVGIPMGSARVKVPYDVVKISEAPVELTEGEGLEVVAERSRLGARTVEATWYVAYVQSPRPDGPVVRIIYVNEPGHFDAHLPAVRDLTRRIRFNAQ